jgi:Family of unknown function (DUF6445)
VLEPTAFPLRASPDVTVHRVGLEHCPIIVVDQVLENASQLVDYATNEVSFDRGDNGEGGYPGVKAAAPLNYVGSLVRSVDSLIRQVYNLSDVVLSNAECSFSIVTTPREALHARQCVPHIDTTYPLQFALLHFLCADSFGGTAFFRQNATGFEIISPNRSDAFERVAELTRTRKDRTRDYVGAQDLDYTQIGAFGAAFNRLLIYPSCVLHSGIIHASTPLVADPQYGRLTVNIFVSYAAK